MARDKLITYIKHHDSFYSGANFDGHSDEQLRAIALQTTRKAAEDRQKSKKKYP
jgi:hypothetical protein